MLTLGGFSTDAETLPRRGPVEADRRCAPGRWMTPLRPGPKICGQKDTPTAAGHVLVAAPAGYFAAFFLRSAQEAVIRSETAFFSSAVIGRRFLVGLASDAVSATGVAAAAGRREDERRAAGFAGAEVPSILSTSFNALISACRRPISLWRSAIAFGAACETPGAGGLAQSSILLVNTHSPWIADWMPAPEDRRHAERWK